MATISSKPHAIVLGDDVQQPGIRVAQLLDQERYRSAKPLLADSELFGRLSAVFQAVPTVLVEEGHRGKHLMEVVINGDLIRAKGGEGFRAWAVDGNGKIAEHATLFEPEKLQQMVNAAAIWQIASLVVAQKHLADISAKLDEIREGVQDIRRFLDEERRGQVLGTMKYLKQVSTTISKGDFSPAIRNQLENCERELLQIQEHLQQELLHQSSESIEHKEWFGTKDLQMETVTKYERLQNLAKDIRLTLKTRVLAWYVLSLYPGEVALKKARMEELLHSAEELKASLQSIEKRAEKDCEQLSSWLNRDTTLAIRRTEVREAAMALSDDLLAINNDTRESVQQSNDMLSSPTHLVFEVEDGRISELRLVG